MYLGHAPGLGLSFGSRAAENDLAKHLTLLYDDADRIPDLEYLF